MDVCNKDKLTCLELKTMASCGEDFDSLLTLLEENLPEGAYLNAANTLRKIHDAMPRTSVNSDYLWEVISDDKNIEMCKAANCTNQMVIPHSVLHEDPIRNHRIIKDDRVHPVVEELTIDYGKADDSYVLDANDEVLSEKRCATIDVCTRKGAIRNAFKKRCDYHYCSKSCLLATLRQQVELENLSMVRIPRLTPEEVDKMIEDAKKVTGVAGRERKGNEMESDETDSDDDNDDSSQRSDATKYRISFVFRESSDGSDCSDDEKDGSEADSESESDEDDGNESEDDGIESQSGSDDDEDESDEEDESYDSDDEYRYGSLEFGGNPLFRLLTQGSRRGSGNLFGLPDPYFRDGSEYASSSDGSDDDDESRPKRQKCYEELKTRFEDYKNKVGEQQPEVPVPPTYLSIHSLVTFMLTSSTAFMFMAKRLTAPPSLKGADSALVDILVRYKRYISFKQLKACITNINDRFNLKPDAREEIEEGALRLLLVEYGYPAAKEHDYSPEQLEKDMADHDSKILAVE